MTDEASIDVDVIRFQAQVFKVATLIDGGIRLTLDLSGADTNAIMALINAKQPGLALEVAAVAVDAKAAENWIKLDNETAKETTGSLDGVDSRRRSIRRN